MVTEKMLDTALCACASGLRRVHCCDADPGLLPGQPAVTLLEAQAQEATKFFNEKKYAEAEALALKLLELAPNQRQALRVLFEIRKAQHSKAAEVLARRLAALPGAPAVVAASNTQLAQLLITQGRHAEAQAPAARALMATPRDASAQHVIGVALTETGQLLAGERHYRRALALLGRDDGLVRANLAWNLKLQGRLDEAAAAYEQALALRPDNKRGVGGYAQVELARGDTAKAIRLLDEALRRWPDDRTLRLLRVLTDLSAGDAQAALARLGDAPETLVAAELSARGKAFERLGRPVEAVTNYATAKKIMRERQGLAYQPEEFLAKFESYKAYFTADRILPLPKAGSDAGFQPVFLLGFPRSGTSLLEQLLAQLQGFAPGDELAPVADLVKILPRLAGAEAETYPEALNHLLVAEGLDLPERLRARYLSARGQIGLARPGVRYITDRNAANAWHLGLIKLLFPAAPIIHVLRHPLDIALSNLGQDRRLEANCHVSMAAAARHYALTMDMIKHYRGQLALRYLPVRYETLVAEPAATLHRILEFIGADPALLPEEASLRANAVRPGGPTPAHYALREPVHRRGVYRYREYLKHMPNLFAEIREILAPWIRELGYEGGTEI
jgi:tetratricopeptide (TPR) repeat protein